MPRSLRFRVTAVGMVTLILVLGIGAWITARALTSALRSDLNAQNAATLDLLAADIESGEPVNSLLLPIGSDGTEFLIVNEDGRLINASLFPEAGTGLPVIFYEDAPGEGFSEAFLEGAVFVEEGPLPDDAVILTQDEWFETRREVVSPDGERLTLAALTPFRILDRNINRLTTTLSFLVPVLALLGGAALWLATGAALRPVRRIADDAARIAPSTSGDRLPVPDTGDGIATLTETLNGMLDRLDDGLTRQRQFISDASHELRSPLTTIKGAAELLAGNPGLPDDVAPSLSLVQRGTARLEAVLDDVTQLAEGDGNVVRREVDLGDLLQAEINGARALNPQLDFDGTQVSQLVVRAEPLQLSRAVQNLLANAARHASSMVAVACGHVDGVIEITVDDDGPGVPPADRDRIFDRFVRLDDGRSRRDGGSGLGLAIVAAIAAAHDGTVACHDAPIGGARFVFRIPA